MACFSLSFGLLVGKCVGKAQPELTNRAVLEHLECPVRNGGGGVEPPASHWVLFVLNIKVVSVLVLKSQS